MFVQVIEGRTSDPEELGRQLGHWITQLQPGAVGYLGTTGGVTNDGRVVILARFESEAAARANSDRPEQGAWWAETEKCFDGAVEFTESSEVDSYLAGGSDAAGFVQLMKVSGVDRQRVADADRQFEQIAPDFRPDLIGGIRIWTAADAFIEANYFTSEKAARDGEDKEPPPELVEGFADFMEMMRKAEYFDFTEPLLNSA
jgi:hypothetical protein